MPEDAEKLERAVVHGWTDERVATELKVDVDRAAELREAYRRAVDIVNAPGAAESFRRGVRYSIRDAVERGLTTEQDIESLVVPICYRAADLAVLLDSVHGRSAHRDDGITRILRISRPQSSRGSGSADSQDSGSPQLPTPSVPWSRVLA